MRLMLGLLVLTLFCSQTFAGGWICKEQPYTYSPSEKAVYHSVRFKYAFVAEEGQQAISEICDYKLPQHGNFLGRLLSPEGYTPPVEQMRKECREIAHKMNLNNWSSCKQ